MSAAAEVVQSHPGQEDTGICMAVEGAGDQSHPGQEDRGGVAVEEGVLVVGGEFDCEACDKTFSTERALKRHKLHHCSKQPGLDPIQLSSRRQAEDPSEGAYETPVTVYQIDKELEKYVSTCSNCYAKFKICEAKTNPLALPAFWPILFDYRGNVVLENIGSKVCHSQGDSILAQILIDGYNFYGVKSIKITSKAYVEDQGLMYPISSYRAPTTHLSLPALNRKDRPIFQVSKAKDFINISFHPEYFAFLNLSLFFSMEFDDSIKHNSQDSHCDSQEKTNNKTDVDDESSINLLFSQVSLDDVDEFGEGFYQKLSQVSIEAIDYDSDDSPVRKVSEPVSKKPRLDQFGASGSKSNISTSSLSSLPSVRIKSVTCNLCGVILKGGVSALNR